MHCSMLQRWGIAWHYQSPRGTLIAQDDVDHWTLHTRPKPGDDPDRVDPDALLTRFMGGSIPCEIILANPWTPHLLVAETYRQGRVFLAGDAAHQYIPTGGYGMLQRRRDSATPCEKHRVCDPQLPDL